MLFWAIDDYHNLVYNVCIQVYVNCRHIAETGLYGLTAIITNIITTRRGVGTHAICVYLNRAICLKRRWIGSQYIYTIAVLHMNGIIK
jgi:hypothetical protein